MTPKLLLAAAIAVFLIGALTAATDMREPREAGKQYRPITVTAEARQ